MIDTSVCNFDKDIIIIVSYNKFTKTWCTSRSLLHFLLDITVILLSFCFICKLDYSCLKDIRLHNAKRITSIKLHHAIWYT